MTQKILSLFLWLQKRAMYALESWTWRTDRIYFAGEDISGSLIGKMTLTC